MTGTVSAPPEHKDGPMMDYIMVHSAQPGRVNTKITSHWRTTSTFTLSVNVSYLTGDVSYRYQSGSPFIQYLCGKLIEKAFEKDIEWILKKVVFK